MLWQLRYRIHEEKAAASTCMSDFRLLSTHLFVRLFIDRLTEGGSIVQCIRGPKIAESNREAMCFWLFSHLLWRSLPIPKPCLAPFSFQVFLEVVFPNGFVQRACPLCLEDQVRDSEYKRCNVRTTAIVWIAGRPSQAMFSESRSYPKLVRMRLAGES